MTKRLTPEQYRAEIGTPYQGQLVQECGPKSYSPAPGVVSIKFDFPLVGKGRPRLGKGRAFTPQKTKDFEKAVALTARIALGPRQPFAGVCRVDVWASFTPPKSTPKKRLQSIYGKPYTGRTDVDNQLKAVCDGLNGIAYRDDRQVAHANIERFYGQENAFRVTITELAQ